MLLQVFIVAKKTIVSSALKNYWK